jgi:hypothetical protein
MVANAIGSFIEHPHLAGPTKSSASVPLFGNAGDLTKRDSAILDKIWVPEYTFINPRGEVVTKEQRMANLKSGATEFKAINPQQEKLQLHGDIAIDIGRVNLEGTRYSGKESSGEYRYMNVWVKKQGQWQMLANQITLIAK